MVSTIDTAFVQTYNAEAHNAFQRKGFKLRNMTRSGTIMAETVYWQKVSALTTQAKTRNAMHTFQDMPHSVVSATMTDRYVPTIIDKLDLLKLNIAELQLHATNHALALGRWADEQVYDVMVAGASATTLGGGDTVTLTVDHMLAVPEAFNSANIPDDGMRFCMVTPKTWTRMLKVDEFSNADYVGANNPMFAGVTAKQWGGVFWFMDTLPDVDGNNVATNLAWHQRCVGHGVAKEFETVITYENLYSAHVAVSCLSSGAAVIDNTGVFKFLVDELA